jgi:hypothetical protein
VAPAEMVSVYLPGLSFLVRESQPLNRTLLTPAWPAKVGEPRLTLPRRRNSVNSRRTVAEVSGVYLKVVPNGARPRLI